MAATDPRPHPVPGSAWIWAARWTLGRVPRRDGDDGVPGAGRRRAGARLVRRRARPARPVPRGLGDQVRAGPPRRARPGLDLDARSTPTCRSCRPATAACRCATSPAMTSGVDWVEDHRDPDGPATALVGAFATGGSSRALLPGSARATRRAPATRTARPTPRCSTGCANAPPASRFRDALGELWRELGCTEDAMVAVDGDGVALAGGGVAAAAGDWARIGLLQLDGAGRAASAARGSSLPAVAAVPGARPAPRAAVDARRVRLPLVAPRRRAAPRVAADGSRGQFVYVDRPRRTVVVKTSAWPYADAAHDAHCRDLTYRTLPAHRRHRRFTGKGPAVNARSSSRAR